MANEKTNFVIGDVVRLKSGSPEMTVIDPSYDQNNLKVPQVKCVWFESSDVKRDQFPQDALKKTDSESSAPGYSVG